MRSHKAVLPILYLALLLWIARFVLSWGFGFYEDDYTLVVRGMASTWAEAWMFISDLLRTFGGQGRPLQHSILFLISRIVGQFGGLHLGYFVAFAIVLLNCILFYLLARKLAGDQFALLAATFYTLYSADTTQAFLYHAFGLQQSLTYFLLAGLAFVSGKKFRPYLLILGSLLSYENTYFVFLAFPLLCYHWDKKLLRRIALHTAIMVSIFLIVVVLRFAIGESRTASLSWPAILTTPLLHMIQGPFVTLGTNFLRPLQALQSLDPAVYVISGLTFILFFWFSVTTLRNRDERQVIHEELETKGGGRDSDIGHLQHVVPVNLSVNLRILITGLIMLILAYPLTFTIRAVAISGRDTRVHFAAILGSSLFWASTWELILSVLKSRAGRRIAAGFLSLNLALLLGFGLIIQKDYAQAWRLQQELWTGILEYVPDLEQGTTIFIDPAGLEDTQYISANTWAMSRVLPYVFDFPETWQKKPAAYRLLPDWQDRVLYNDQEIKVVNFSWDYVTSNWGDTVLLNTEDNHVSGRSATMRIEGEKFYFKTLESTRIEYHCGFLSELILTRMDDQASLCH